MAISHFQTSLSRSNPSCQRGFSLIELMITITLIGTLSVIAQANYTQLSTRAKRNRAISEMAGMSTLAVGQRHTENKSLIELTGSMCTWCAMGNFGGLLPGGSPATITPNATAQGIATFGILGFSSVPTDPWGRVYLVDVNELENGIGDCRYDAISSAGEDGIWETASDGCFGDDLIFRLPYYTAHPLGSCTVIGPFLPYYDPTKCL